MIWLSLYGNLYGAKRTLSRSPIQRQAKIDHTGFRCWLNRCESRKPCRIMRCMISIEGEGEEARGEAKQKRKTKQKN
ncbi:hypothetical protein X777_14253 [Ooceraea biroi]|uniref:Uncharacterized protein n=1 Tax=Ooceraea biroi TaxID=2015173 RepID=A0A026WXA7_OOCBI|nr:hypothetical protein X777_14253 [Ooceraea biroi]